jgi:SAM-dependent methyltransferase
MESKPELFSSHYGEWFRDPLVVEAYPARPPYPRAVFEHLAALAVDRPRTVLDAGSGPGDIARGLAPLVDHVDAVDASAGMIEAGRTAIGGDAPNLRWILSRIEDAQLDSTYALITAGESLHWFDWQRVMPRFADLLTPNGMLALAGRNWGGPSELDARLLPIFKRFSPVPWQNVNLLDELKRRGLFEVVDERRFAPEPWQPTLDEYILARHSQRSFSRTHLGATAVAEFDAAMREALADVPRVDGRLQLAATAWIIWGRPQR